MRKENKGKSSIKSLLKPALVVSAIFALLTIIILREFAVFTNANSELLTNTVNGNVKGNADIFGKRVFEQVSQYFFMCVQYLFVALTQVAFAVVVIGAIFCVIGLIARLLNSSRRIEKEISFERVNDQLFDAHDFSAKNAIPFLTIQNLN